MNATNKYFKNKFIPKSYNFTTFELTLITQMINKYLISMKMKRMFIILILFHITILNSCDSNESKDEIIINISMDRPFNEDRIYINRLTPKLSIKIDSINLKRDKENNFKFIPV